MRRTASTDAARPPTERQDVVRPDRPKDGRSQQHPGFELRAHLPLALLLASAALAAAAPVVIAEPGANAASGEHVPPGQAKKAEAVADTSTAPPSQEDAPAPAPSQETVTPSRSAGSTSTGSTSNGNGNGNGAKQSKAQSPNSPRYAGSTSSGGTTQPSGGSAPAVVAKSSSTTTPPAASQAGQPSTAVSTRSARRAQSSTSVEGTAARRAAAARQAAADDAASFAAGLDAGAAPGADARADAVRTIVGQRTLVDTQGSAPADESPPARNVVEVLTEVVPGWMRWALGALAALGLLLGAFAAIQTLRRRRLERQRRMLLADVGVLQSALLPELPERIGGARVTAAYRPADGLAAGGDFYDAFELPGGRTGVLIGDVAGHGRDAVPLTALVRYNLRAYLEAGLPPRATLHVASNVLAPHLGGRQVTIAVAIFDPGTGRLTYACAGHWPPLLLGSDVKPVTVCSSPPIGVDAPTGRRQTTIALPPGAAACFHTDGLDEAPVAYGRLGRDGVSEELHAVGPQGRAGELLERVVRRSRRQPDDMAACILEALPGGCDSWSLRLEELEVDASAIGGGWAERFMDDCGVGRAHIAKALREAREIVAHWGTAVLVVRMGEELAEVRVTPPPAITLPTREPAAPAEAQRVGEQRVARAG
jgi:hypothetical protein